MLHGVLLLLSYQHTWLSLFDRFVLFTTVPPIIFVFCFFTKVFSPPPPHGPCLSLFNFLPFYYPFAFPTSFSQLLLCLLVIPVLGSHEILLFDDFCSMVKEYWFLIDDFCSLVMIYRFLIRDFCSLVMKYHFINGDFWSLATKLPRNSRPRSWSRSLTRTMLTQYK